MPVLLLGGMVGMTSSVLGAGGLTLTVPVLIYLVGMDAPETLTASLVAVTLMASAAALPQSRLQLVSPRCWLAFAAAGAPGALVGTWLNGAIVGRLLFSLFALSICLVAGLMTAGQGRFWKRGLWTPLGAPVRARTIGTLGETGFVAGALVGLFGVGGGFMVVPLLMAAGRLSVHQAVATSLLVVPVTAGVGILAHLRPVTPDWATTALFTVGGMAGAALGALFMVRVSGPALQSGFGYMLILLSLLMLLVL